MGEFTEAEKEALTAYRPREYKHAFVRQRGFVAKTFA